MMEEPTSESIVQPQFVEELLTPDDNRFVMFPIKYNDVFALYKKSIDCFWKVDDVDLSKDVSDWKKLNNDEKHFIKMVLAFFSSSDGIICEIFRFVSQMKSRCLKSVHFTHFKILWNQYIRKCIVY
jgi:ribonucleoside-diphosphate reductase subunit M2